MKKILALITFLVLAITLNFVRANQLESIKPLDAHKMQQDKSAVIVDVRELDELKEGMVKEAISAPISTMKNKKDEWDKIVATLPKDKTIIVYCKSGGRAKKVGEDLVKKGFKVLNMGGFESWQKAGLPVEKK